MQFIFKSIILSLCICLFAPLLPSCGKIELTDDQTEKPDDEGGDDHNQPPTDNPDDYALNVCQLPDVADGTEVYVAGYIVGFVPVPGSIKNMVFGTADAEASNLVIADYPDETDPKRCAAVQLTKGTEAREELNLLDHPENQGRLYTLGASSKSISLLRVSKTSRNLALSTMMTPQNPTNLRNPTNLSSQLRHFLY